MVHYLDFEKPFARLEGEIKGLMDLERQDNSVNLKEEIATLEAKADDLLRSLYGALDPWQKTQVARHPSRPHFVDYIRVLVPDWTPLAGDRNFAEDHALMGGLGSFEGRPVLVIGHEKGSDTQSRVHHNFGMARPEGYRKIVRLMSLAEKFDLAVISLVDTPGAYPGVGAEERGQSEAIARSTEKCLSLRVANVVVVIGEGGSGGAVALASANKVLMLEHSIYTVASPEASASILWRDAARAKEAASAMKVTAQSLQELGVIDGIIAEPLGGAHRDPKKMITATGAAIAKALGELAGLGPDELRRHRRDKFMTMGRPESLNSKALR